MSRESPFGRRRQAPLPPLPKQEEGWSEAPPPSTRKEQLQREIELLELGGGPLGLHTNRKTPTGEAPYWW